jgi:hypothetical protein
MVRTDMGARRPRLVWKYEFEDEDGAEIGPVWLDTFGDDPKTPIGTEDLGWTTREQARLIAKKRGCDFAADDGQEG